MYITVLDPTTYQFFTSEPEITRKAKGAEFGRGKLDVEIKLPMVIHSPHHLFISDNLPEDLPAIY